MYSVKCLQHVISQMYATCHQSNVCNIWSVKFLHKDLNLQYAVLLKGLDVKQILMNCTEKDVDFQNYESNFNKFFFCFKKKLHVFIIQCHNQNLLESTIIVHVNAIAYYDSIILEYWYIPNSSSDRFIRTMRKSFGDLRFQ